MHRIITILLTTLCLAWGCCGPSHHGKDKKLDNSQFQTETPYRALPIHATFLAECILAGMHLYDFEEFTTVL